MRRTAAGTEAMGTLNTLAALLVFQAIGEVVALALRLPVPGPVIGMALLLAWLMLRDDAAARLRPTCVELLRHLSLLFVPAGVGVMLHAARLAEEWLPIAVALGVSTALAIAVTALVTEFTRRRMARRRTG
jgi:holin-like protein